MNKKSVNYDELFYLASDGNEAAWNDLITTYVHNYRKTFINMYGDTLGASEVEATMYYAIAKAIEKYNPRSTSSVKTYLTRCVKNQLKTDVKARYFRLKTVDFDQESIDNWQISGSSYQIIDETLSLEYAEFYEQLAPNELQLLEARIAGKSIREIAVELNITRSKATTIQERLKTKAKQYGLVEKNF